jgi:hypothetical protein
MTDSPLSFASVTPAVKQRSGAAAGGMTGVGGSDDCLRASQTGPASPAAEYDLPVTLRRLFRACHN